MKTYILPLIFLILVIPGFGQSLEDLLDQEVDYSAEPELISATFKSTQLINSHTIKIVNPGELVFLISHRFGYLNSGFSDLFGLDNATVRFGFQYGIDDRLSIGIGRSTYKRNYDLFAKYAVLKQNTGNIPLSLSLLGVGNISSARWPNDNRDYLFAHRMTYSAQLLLARKFSNAVSIQLMPTYIHRNLVETAQDPNDILALGAGGRVKLSNWVALTFEYYHSLTPGINETTTNPLSLGFDIETGGHVFQLFFTNTSAIYTSAYVAETTDRWTDGNIRFGFNISRTF